MLSKFSKEKWAVIAILAGFLFIMFDQNISLGGFCPYPDYVTSYDYNPEFQYYTLDYLYGAKCPLNMYSSSDVLYNLKLDIVPDVLGFILIALAAAKLIKYSRLFSLVSLMSWASVVLYGVIHIIPFFLNGMQLSYAGFFLGIAMFGMEAVVGYVFVSAICDTLSGFEHRQARKNIILAWFVTIVINAVICVLRWINVINPSLLVVYEIMQLCLNVLFYYFVYKDIDFIVKKKTL